VIAFLADEDFNGRIIRGLFRLVPDLNLLTVSGAGLAGQTDSTVISGAAANGRVLLTHDLNTMIDVALDRVRIGQPMPGVVAVPQQMGIGAAISDLALIATCAEPRELAGQVWYLPL
jgi:predicted nuclease of predicted toxin-antitoxin system